MCLVLISSGSLHHESIYLPSKSHHLTCLQNAHVRTEDIHIPISTEAAFLSSNVRALRRQGV